MNVPLISAIALAGVASGIASSTALPAVTLISPNDGSTTTLIDSAKTTVKTFSHKLKGGYSAFLTDSGTVIRSAIPSSGNTISGDGAPQGAVEETDWNGNQVRMFTYSNDTVLLHHAIWPMPNGHVLGAAWQKKTKTQVTAAGFSSASVMYPDKIVEFDRSGNVVWSWCFWDHLTSSDSASLNPGRVSRSLFTNSYPTHINSVSYDPVHDLVVISSHYLNEVYVIDHSTTTAQAATSSGGNYGKGGEILFRWGCPSNYGKTGTQFLKVVHGGAFVDSGLPGAGNILCYANADPSLGSSSGSSSGPGGMGGGGGSSSYSRSFEIAPQLSGTSFASGTDGQFLWDTVFTWYRTESKYQSSGNWGNVQRLPNGNTFIDNAKGGSMVEVDSAGNILWEYDGSASTARAYRYAYSYKGISALTSLYTGGATSPTTAVASRTVASFRAFARGGLLAMDGLGSGARVRVLDVKGQLEYEGTPTGGELQLSTSAWASGIHLIQVVRDGSLSCRTVSILH